MKIMLKSDGIICLVWDTKLRRDVSRKVPYEDALRFMTWPVQSVEGATVANLAQILRSDVELYSELLSAPNLDLMLGEIPKVAEPKEAKLEKVMISWACEDHEYDGKVEFTLYPSASGVGPYKGEEHEGGPKNGETIENYGLDFTPFYEIVDLPIVLDEEVKMFSSRNVDGKYSFKDTKLGCKTFTLFDILYALVDEVTFFGCPETRDATLDDLKQSVKEIEEGTAKLIPWDDVKEELKKKIDEEKKKKDAEGLAKGGDAPEA